MKGHLLEDFQHGIMEDKAEWQAQVLEINANWIITAHSMK